MQRLFVICILLLVGQGCAHIQDLNPFTPRSINAEETTYGQFPHIPVITALSPALWRTQVNLASDGSKYGVESYEGNVTVMNLSRAMVGNMTREGWALRTALANVGREIQVYERENMYAVMYYHRQTTTTALDIWVGSRLPDGTTTLPDSVHAHMNSAQSSGSYTAPASSTPTQPTNPAGTVQERALP